MHAAAAPVASHLVSEAAFPVAPARVRRRRLGYLMAMSAAALWAVNGTVSKVILAHGISSGQLAAVRSTGAFVGLALVLAVVAPGRLRITWRELPFLAFFGICGLAFVQWFYFLAIHRLDIGVALLIQYLAPLLVALWARFASHEHVRRRIWVALILALTGLSLMVDLWHGFSLNGLGVAAALLGAGAYALYILQAEHAVGRRGPVSLICWGFLFASVFWAAFAPWWDFPLGDVDDSVSLLGNLDGVSLPVWSLMAWMVLLGTIVPFALLVGALRHIPATRAGIVAMLEPVVATLVAWLWLAESLDTPQLVGAAIVLAAILLAQTAR
jgi:drug/metabolite transporter (DMT)-like permease